MYPPTRPIISIAIALCSATSVFCLAGEVQEKDPVGLFYTSHRSGLFELDVAFKQVAENLDERVNETLKVRRERELAEIDKACKLSDDQKQSLQVAFAMHDSTLTKSVRDLVSELLDNPRFKGDENQIMALSDRVAALNLQFHRSYLRSESIGMKVIETRFTTHQKQLLKDYVLERFVNRFVGPFKLDEQQTGALKQIVADEAKRRTEFLYDEQILLDSMLSSANQRPKPTTVSGVFGPDKIESLTRTFSGVEKDCGAFFEQLYHYRWSPKTLTRRR